MQRKLTITVDEEVYTGLHEIIGPRNTPQVLFSLIFVITVRNWAKFTG